MPWSATHRRCLARGAACPPGPAAEHADLTYVRRAITDDTWLNELGPIPVGPRRLQTSAPVELAAPVGPALEQARGVGPDQVVRLVDFLMRAGVDDEQLSAALSRDVVASLAIRSPVRG